MRYWRKTVGRIALLAIAVVSVGVVAAETKRPYERTAPELFDRGKWIVFPESEERYDRDVLGEKWDLAAADRGNFVFFDNVSDVKAAGPNAMSFALKDGVGTLGWGNYAGKQPAEKRFRFWKRVKIVFDVRQSRPEPTRWALRFWRDGRRDAPISQQNLRPVEQARFFKETSGTEWRTIEFDVRTALPPDGFDLEVNGSPDNEIQIRDLKIQRPLNVGYAFKEFSLPEGKVWKAVADIGNVGVLYVNGRKIPSKTSIYTRPFYFNQPIFWQESVNLAPYLKPGQKNRVGLYGYRGGYPPYVTLRGSVIMVDGTRIPLDTDTSWRWSPKAEAGWSAPGAKTGNWRAIDEKPKTGAATNASLGSPLTLKRNTHHPGYDGLIDLASPTDNRLYFSNDKPVEIWASIPCGLIAESPVIHWELRSYQNGKVGAPKTGEVSRFVARENSSRATIDLGEIARGVYIFDCRLLDGKGTVIEERASEPIVVVGKIPMKTVLGTTYEEGMDLELEKEIDLTNPNDPAAPWMEIDGLLPSPVTASVWDKKNQRLIDDPRVVEKDGLKYRETRPYYGAQISYLVHFKHPGDFYLMVLEYPNNVRRLMGVSCSSDNMGWGPIESLYSKAGVSVWTGDKCPIDNKMAEMKWLYRPDPCGQAINLLSLTNEVPAAASKLRIYHIKGGLPALAAPAKNTRWFGHVTEGGSDIGEYLTAFGMYTKKAPKDPRAFYAQFDAQKDSRPVLEMCAKLSWHLDAAEAFTQYLRFCGQNLFVMGCYQYDDGNEGFLPLPDSGDPSLNDDMRGVLFRVLNANAIDFMAGVEFASSDSLRFAAEGDAGPEALRHPDCYYMVDKNGREIQLEGGIFGFNFNHPKVRESMYRLADDLARTYGRLPRFRGINWSAFFGGDWLPSYRTASGNYGELDLGYDDATIARFEKDTGTQLPISATDPDRFKKRYQLLTSPRFVERWKQWRAESVVNFYEEATRRVRKVRPDLKVNANLMYYHAHAKEQRESGKSLRDYLRDWGWDAALFAEKDIPLCHYSQASLAYAPYPNVFTGNGKGFAYGWDIITDTDYFETFASDKDDRLAMAHHHWIEAESSPALFPDKEGWPRPFQATMQGQAIGDNAGEFFASLLVGDDPSIFLFGFSDCGYLVGDEQPMRRFAQALRTLPTEKFSPVLKTGLETNLAVRQLRKDGKLYFYVVNPGYWPIEGSVTVKNAGKVVELVTEKIVAEKGVLSGETLCVPIALRPYSFMTYAAESPDAEIVGWANESVSESDLSWLNGMIDAADKLLADERNVIVLDPDGLKYTRDAVADAKAALKKGEYAKAWHIVTRGRFWILVNEYLKKAAEYSTETKRADITKEKRELRAKKTAAAPVIDGKLDDPAWQTAVASEGFMDNAGRPAITGAALKALYDDDNLYLAVVCRDRFPEKARATAGKEGEINANRDDRVALFLKPDAAVDLYYQMAFNPAGLKFDQEVKGGARNYDYAPPWEVKTSKTADAWVAEIKMPKSIYKNTQIVPGGRWGFNAHRAFRLNEIPPTHWNYTPGDLHDPDSFGSLVFDKH